MGKMHPDLMGAPRLQPAGQMRRSGLISEARFDTGARDRVAPLPLGHDRLFLTICAVARNGCAQAHHGAGLEPNHSQSPEARITRLWHAVDQRVINPVHRVGRELRRKTLMRAVGLRGHEQAGSLLVDPVHDARTLFATDPGQAVAAMVHESIHKRSRRTARGRMNDHSGRLVNHDQIAVLINDLERDRLGRKGNLFGQTDADRQDIASSNARLGACQNLGAAPDISGIDQFDKPRPAQAQPLWHIPRQRPIKARRRVGLDLDRDLLAVFWDARHAQ